MTSPSRAPYYRLRGTIEGEERSAYMGPGVTRVGAACSSDFVIPVRGVSREHATFEVDADRVVVLDHDSKNGTFVNGTRVRRALLHAGDLVRLGPVELRLEEAQEGDTRLAVVLEELQRPADRDGRRDETSSVGLGRTGRGAGLERLAFLELCLDALGSGAPNGRAAALRLLARRLGATGACVLEGSAPDRAVGIAAVGDVPDVPAGHSFWAEQARVARRAERHVLCVSGAVASLPPLSWVVLAGPRREPLSLLVRGTRTLDKEDEALVRILLRLLSLSRSPGPAATSRATGDAHAQLVFPDGYVAGESPAIREAYQALLPLLHSDLPVLLEGETGVGKEWIARILHLSSRRREGPFVAVNCAAIPAELVEAELFGVREGAATGTRERAGRFQAASGGTLFLDEIGEMPLAQQAKLLRALEQKEVSPVGGAPVRVDLRVITATNCDLRRKVEAHVFRSDLYYRVAGVAVRVPPLRERPEDIALMVESLLRRFSRESGKAIPGITVRALQQLRSYPWPGNFRELQHEIELLVSRCPAGQAIDSSLLPERILQAPDRAAIAPPVEALRSLRLADRVREVEKDVIAAALARTGGSQRKAARLLGISRNALARKVRREDPPS